MSGPQTPVLALDHPWWPSGLSLARRELLLLPARSWHCGLQLAIAFWCRESKPPHRPVAFTNVALVVNACRANGEAVVGPRETAVICAHGEQGSLGARWDERLTSLEPMPAPDTNPPMPSWWVGMEGQCPPHELHLGWTFAALFAALDLQLDRVEDYS